MGKEVPEAIHNEFARARALHDRAASDYSQCLEFNKLMADLMDRLEDAGCQGKADKVMTLLLDCNPKEGARCDKATLVGERIKKF